MNKNFKWYSLLVVATLFLIGYVILGSPTFRRDSEKLSEDTERYTEETYETDLSASNNQLPIPPLLEDQNPEEGKAEFHLQVQNGQAEFVDGYEADTLGYNGSYLGPVIRVNRGDEVTINVQNELDNEATTVHWHGLEVEGEMDGGPHQRIESDSSWTPEFTVDQPAATLWYHPHLMNTTGEQVYKGLAGLFYIDDEYSESLDIPKNYGVNDIPLIVQDKRFTEDGQIPYELSMPDQMNGFMGDTVLINATIEPQLDVKNEVVRLRILNGSNARSYDFNFDDGSEFYQIASDGGFLEDSVPLDHLELAPAERAEILLDLSDYEVGEQLSFRDADNQLMTLQVTEESQQDRSIPENLVEIEKHQEEDIWRSRDFVMTGAGPMVAINGKQMDLDRIDEEVKVGELEEWFVFNGSHSRDERERNRNQDNHQRNRQAGARGMMDRMHSTPHPFHVHGAQFQIVERNGERPPANERGWKDTVMLREDEEVRLLVKFNKKGLFMYHCHILEHEDAGMMGQLLVE